MSAFTDDFFRRQTGELTAGFARIFGAHHLDLAEKVARGTLLRAARHWPFSGVPECPKRWLREEARRQAQILLQREGTVRSRILLLLQEFLPRETAGQDIFVAELEANGIDDKVKLLYLLCHPLLPVGLRGPLILKHLAGWSVAEIAAAWGAEAKGVEESLAGGRRKIKVRRLTLSYPVPAEMGDRVTLVTDALEELYNLPDFTRAGSQPLRLRGAAEAVRLATLLASHAQGQHPIAQAHAALLLLPPTVDRLPPEMRISPERLTRAAAFLEGAAKGAPLSRFHLAAGKAAVNHIEFFSGRAGEKLLTYFDQLLAVEDTPTIALQRSWAYLKVLGPAAGRHALGKRKASSSLCADALFSGAFAELYAKEGIPERARTFYQEALVKADTVAGRRFFMRKLNGLDLKSQVN